MELDTIIAQEGLADHCVLEYFGTLYEISSHFCCTGEEILRQNGFRDRAWVESLFELAAQHRCFANANCPEGLPFQAVRPLITQEIVAHFCLAADILETTYYEYLMHQRHQMLNSWKRSKIIEQTMRRLRIARRKFGKRKAEYLNLAYKNNLPKRIGRALDICTVYKESQLQKDILFTFELMPTIFQLHPRDENAADMAPVRKLRRKHSRLFTICTDLKESQT